MIRMCPSLLPALACSALLTTTLPAGEDDKPTGDYKPFVAAASGEAQETLAGIKHPKGTTLSVFAAEPLLANPVAFGIDEQGRFYVCETFRLHAGVTDNRSHMNWVEDELASRTVADRVEVYRKYLGENFATYTTEHERLRLIVDTDGDGKADQATVFADGFKEAADGIAAGVLPWNGDVYYTCIPDLYLLRDTDADGVADVKKSLATGFGVHVALLGHDLHGLIMGPDGRLYFSIGDRGLNVTTKEGRHLYNPDSGAVLRCEPDGSDLEIFATGLRNPQELAFDDYGNLFTVDNNSDSGDQARIVHVVRGGDSGWRTGYQYHDMPGSRGPWNAENLWYPADQVPNGGHQPAYLLPPLANFSDGPSGLAYSPGTGLPDEYANTFFLCDFRGTPTTSGVLAFKLEPNGASFKLVGERDEFLWNTLVTDVDFGWDGAMYVSDWVEGWNMTGKGRIYRLDWPGHTGAGAAAEVPALIAAGFKERDTDELLELLGHADRRVRLRAQYGLAERKDAIEPLVAIAEDETAAVLPRLHAFWACGQTARMARQRDEGMADMPPLPSQVSDPAVRKAAIAFWGDNAAYLARQSKTDNRSKFVLDDSTVNLLRDPEPSVRFAVAMNIAKIGIGNLIGVLQSPGMSRGLISSRKAADAIVGMLAENSGRDPYLQHAGVMALATVNDNSRLVALRNHESQAVRLAAVVALRRLKSDKVAEFLADADPHVAAEAAIAINDADIASADPALAAKAAELDPPGTQPLVLRAINANFRLGGAEHATAVARVAAAEPVSQAARLEALDALADWADPSVLDRVVGIYRPVPGERDGAVARAAFEQAFGDILAVGPASVRVKAVETAGSLKAASVADRLVTLVGDEDSAAEVRTAALTALESMVSGRLADAVQAAVESKANAVRLEGIRLMLAGDSGVAFDQLREFLAGDDLAIRQRTFEILGQSQDGQAAVILADWMDKLLEGTPPPELALDILSAARANGSEQLVSQMLMYDEKRPSDTPIGPWIETLRGGSVAGGRDVFLNKKEVACARCHRIGRDGGLVGPTLDAVGAEKKRDYILRSIVAPDAEIAKGFETVVVATEDGEVLTGVFKSEDDDTLRLMTAQAKELRIAKDTIAARKSGKSAMPADIVKDLSKKELRDLVEYLATRRSRDENLEQ